jgi:hypothetical protein
MEFTGTNTQVWAMQSLWIALAIAIGSTLTFSSLFLIGYVAQAIRPESRFARYFEENSLFVLWMTSMICGIGLVLLLFLLGVGRFSTQNQFMSGFLTTLSTAAILSPLVTIYAITHSHARAQRRRARIVSKYKPVTARKRNTAHKPVKKHSAGLKPAAVTKQKNAVKPAASKTKKARKRA